MSRNINDLRPDMQELARRFSERMAEKNVPVLIYSTLRTMEEQARLFRQGRSLASIRRAAEDLRQTWNRDDLADVLMGVGPQTGPKRTNAAPGQSLHNYGVAFDGAPMRNGEIVWGTEGHDARLWRIYGETGKSLGLEWGGDWASFIDMPHLQVAGANWRELIRGS